MSPDAAELLSKVEAAAGRLKVFPLPSVVLFPGAALPLHIFEPRYRAMVEDALASDGIFAMAQLESGWEKDYAGKPQLKPWLCAGHISLQQKLEDGRFHVVLTGIVRVRLVEELASDKLYREVKGEVVKDAPYEGPAEDQVRQAVVALLSNVPKEVGTKVGKVTQRLKGGAFADVLAATLVNDVDRRYPLLAEPDVHKRLQKLLTEVSGLVARLNPGNEGLKN